LHDSPVSWPLHITEPQAINLEPGALTPARLLGAMIQVLGDIY
jgi:hypothetical protein